MNSIIKAAQNGDSPFDSIRGYRADGSEYWLGRELMRWLGYAKWQNAEKAIKRAKKSLENQGHVSAEHLTEVSKDSRSNGLGVQVIKDFELSRLGCYTVAMNADPDKEMVALAQGYFAAKTREAEVRDKLDPEKPTLAEIAQFADVVFRGTDVHPNVQSAIKLNAIEKHYPQMSGMCADTRKQLPVAVDRLFLNVTDLAKLYNAKYGYLTLNETERGEAIALNKLLIDRGYQAKNPSGNPNYLPTEIGKKYSETMLDTAPGHGKSILTLKWCDSILDILG